MDRTLGTGRGCGRAGSAAAWDALKQARVRGIVTRLPLSCVSTALTSPCSFFSNWTLPLIPNLAFRSSRVLRARTTGDLRRQGLALEGKHCQKRRCGFTAAATHAQRGGGRLRAACCPGQSSRKPEQRQCCLPASESRWDEGCWLREASSLRLRMDDSDSVRARPQAARACADVEQRSP